MPDRAVVDDEYEHRCPTCGSAQTFACRDCTHLIPAQPRAISALSEDRQWLVVLTPDEGRTPAGRWWDVWRRVGDKRYEYHDYCEDTGQSADVVLREFLNSK